MSTTGQSWSGSTVPARSTFRIPASAGITGFVSPSATSTRPKPTFDTLWTWSRKPGGRLVSGFFVSGRNEECWAVYYRTPIQPLFIDKSGRSLMTATANRIAAVLTLGVFTALPLAAQNAPSCDPTANTRGDIAKAQFSMTRAISASDKGNPTRDIQEVLRLVENGTDNPTARNYLRGEAYILYLMQPNTPAVVPRSAVGLTSNPTGTIDLFVAADSAFTAVEKATPECAALTSQWRQQKPWLNT